MNTVTAILEADTDGSVHLPVPAEMFGRKIRVVAVLATVQEEAPTSVSSASAARDWVLRARGSVQLAPGESVDDVLLAHYSGKENVSR